MAVGEQHGIEAKLLSPDEVKSLFKVIMIIMTQLCHRSNIIVAW